MIRITFLSNDNKTIELAEPGNLLRASLREKGGIPFKCGGGLCGTCKCRIESGIENTDAVKPKERNHLSPRELEEGWRMACQTFILGDVTVSWIARGDAPQPVAIDREGLILARSPSKP